MLPAVADETDETDGLLSHGEIGSHGEIDGETRLEPAGSGARCGELCLEADEADEADTAPGEDAMGGGYP